MSQSDDKLSFNRFNYERALPTLMWIHPLICCMYIHNMVVGDAAQQIHVFLRSRVPAARLRPSSCRLSREELLLLLLLSYINSSLHLSSHLQPWLQVNAVYSTDRAPNREETAVFKTFM